MRISDIERREVAAKLRENAGLPSRLPNEYSIEVKSALVLSKLLDCIDCSDDVFPRLADLIDRPSTTRHGKFRTKYGRQTPCCDVCGYSIGDMRWGYCPKCGAVITDD